ncbi:hypothetical protein [Streptomyces gardneri]|uniref:Uncharacterized protein n=1 Tax=Streptomyces gardneri TaxID=66892 RepID=A0A4Y3RCL3_9ACTN|nr:hypothetical protein [Streptomyces gardneri]GEB55505.1 hypothetical protein SGA01_11100 [Streptomyces gardneri]GHH10553.1 hypothetical protein GCM10017674_55110 [Streptomyces gardneri]
MLRRRFPGHSVTIVPADTASRAGWALTSRDKGEKVKYRYWPQYFAEVWRPGEASRVFPLACKGDHGNSAASADQLASASVHTEAVHIGAWNETPALLCSTEIPTDGGTMAVHALEAPGSGGRLSPAEGREPNLDASPTQANVMPDIHPPARAWWLPIRCGAATCSRRTSPGSRSPWPTPPRRASWPLRAPAAPSARYLTEPQGHKRFTGLRHAASTSVQDTAHKLLGTEYVGTDHVFRLNGPHVEAFSGVDQALFRLLARGDVEEYRAVVHAGRDTRPRLTFDKS